MANIFQQQQEMMKIIFQKIQTEKDNLDKMYSEFVNKLTNDNPNNKQYNEIDELFLSKVNKAKEFNDSFTNNDCELLYWYDMNEKKFINPIDGYNNKIIKKFNFEIYLFSSQDFFCQTKKNEFKLYAEEDGETGELVLKDNRLLLNILIDNHLNIILEDIKTILVSNYSIFPIYSLYCIYSHINMSEIKIFDFEKMPWSSEVQKRSDNERIKYRKISSILHQFKKFISSEEHRNKFLADGNNFQDILDFIKYNDMIDNIKPHLDFLASIECKKEIVKSSQSYDDILFQQIKDLQKQVEGYKKQIAKLEKEKEEYNS